MVSRQAEQQQSENSSESLCVKPRPFCVPEWRHDSIHKLKEKKHLFIIYLFINCSEAGIFRVVRSFQMIYALICFKSNWAASRLADYFYLSVC